MIKRGYNALHTNTFIFINISISFRNIEIKESNIVSEKLTIQNIERY